MKILVYILSITNSIFLTWIVQQERLNSRVPLTLPQFTQPAVTVAPELKYVEPAELLPDIQSFDDTLREGPQAELFPDVAQVQTKKRKK
jgi:hypothetical protein